MTPLLLLPQGMRRTFGRVARSGYAWVYVLLVSLLLNAGITALTGVPGPETHDEFSYLLAADTFAHGRLTNPPHPLWQHFESFHILQQPTYQSKYQPGQGLILALGQVATGLPIAGAWLATALAAAAVCWALRAVLPARWALVAGLLVALHPLAMLWGQNYWGGSLPAVGGALVFGAAVRLARRPRVRDAALLALGITVLFNTRPYEGGVFAALVVIPLLARREFWRRPAVLLVVGGVLALAAGWTGYYDYRVTGNPFQLPYLVHERQYALAPPFLWQRELPPKTYRNDSLRQYNEGVELPHYRRQRESVGGFLRGAGEKLWILAKAYVWAQPVLVAMLVGLPWALWRGGRRGAVRRAGVVLVLFLAALMLSNWTFAHYAAPAACVAIFLVVASLRPIRLRWPVVLPVVLVVYVGTAAYWVVDRVRTYPQSWGRVRQSVVADLVADPGDDLVIVRYPAGRNINTEWVYNPANIDAAPVVFARDMGPAADARLIEYFRGRKVWLLTVGPDRTSLDPYPR